MPVSVTARGFKLTSQRHKVSRLPTEPSGFGLIVYTHIQRSQQKVQTYMSCSNQECDLNACCCLKKNQLSLH